MVNTACTGADCACVDAGELRNACNGECVSTQSDPEHCGGCNQACGAGQYCERGRCQCTGGRLACDGRCIDPSVNSQHCGACGRRCADTELCQAGSCELNTTGCVPACSGGQACNDGECSCPAAQSFCDAQCVDTQSDPANCGECGVSCGAQQSCNGGACTCDDGKTPCGTRCSDFQTDAQNCGGCGLACSQNQACSAGKCQSVWQDGCLDQPARGVQLRELAVYQSLKIPIVDANGAVPVDQRVADVIQGRSGVFRAFIDLDVGFIPRNLSARLAIHNGANVTRFAVRQPIAQSSSDDNLQSTFTAVVPGDKLGPNTSYTIEIVDCGPAIGAVYDTRFPRAGEMPLEAHKAGTLKVVIIPVIANGREPDLTAGPLEVYRSYVEAMYPIERLELQVGTEISTEYPINWNTLIEQLRAKRELDNPAADVYYYGMLQPTETLRDYCRGGCTAGIGYVTPQNQPSTRAAVGLAYAEEISASTMAHELGHNHGRKHSRCPKEIAGVDDMSTDAKVGSWGFDARTGSFLDPSKTLDVMGYCDPKWISITTYRGLIERITDVNKTGGITASGNDPLEQFRVLIVEPEGPRWSVPHGEAIAPYGTPELADVLDIDGQVITQIIVHRTEIPETNSSTFLVPEPEDGWNAIQITGTVPLPFSAPITVPMP